jgi:HD-GYP domain-containing protein (c-di-GMP phosphodiesterase class II)
LIPVADAYDATTNERPYRRVLRRDRAVEELDPGSGSQFDPDVVESTKAVLRGSSRGHAETAGPGPRR